MRLLAAAVLTVSLLGAQPGTAGNLSVTAVRHWSLADVTRIAVEVSGEFEFRSDRLHNPERAYFDILNANPHFDGKRARHEPIDDKLVSKVRIAAPVPGITRVVLDLSGPVEIATSKLANPSRLIIEVRPGAAIPDTPATATTTVSTPPLVKPEIKPDLPAPLNSVAKPANKADVPGAEQVTAEPSKVQLAKSDPPAAERPVRESPPAEKAAPERSASEKAASGKPPVEKAQSSTADAGRAARHTSTGETSLVRALGLKVSRIVIDPGHGGHDQGTSGPKGLLEKDLVLDVAQRVGKLVQDRMGAEVIYTRTDDTFVPLEGRTEFANDRKADLFLSIHANSSPVSRITGVETYYLNFTDSKEALDVASRENASSQKSVFELQDVLQKITRHEKAEESREFAARVQSSLYAFSARNFPGNKNRGVKKAPFVVLIGAHMPSILAEVGFISNPREEALLKRPDYRQKLAEALFRGVQRYADSLSHFQVAQASSSR